MGSRECTVGIDDPMPNGYAFLKKGDKYKTQHCRLKTHEAGKTLYVVKEKHLVLGLRAPKWILGQVHKEERESRQHRRDAVKQRDATAHDEFEEALRQQFPSIPDEDATTILRRTLRKHSGRVGRTGRLTLEDKVKLAVTAHVRHKHTDYDAVLKETGDREQARKAMWTEIYQKTKSWKR